MSAVITITVSGPSDFDNAVIVQTICEALKDATLDVQWMHGEAFVAITTLYEHQARLAMAGMHCVVKVEDSI